MLDTENKALVTCHSVRRLELPLKRPYKLAFGPVEFFDTILVTLSLNDRIGYGEATVLTGYTEETIEESWTLAQSLATEIGGLEVSEAKALLHRHLARAPFTVTAFYTALEMGGGHPILNSDRRRVVPLLKIMHGMEAGEISEELEQAIAEGYRTIKAKAGFEVGDDLARVRLIQRLARGRLNITVDANQGYGLEDGLRFTSNLTPEGIQFFEQACDKDDWDGAVKVARAASVPVMLDESIYDIEDIRKVAALRAASYVKVKLMKFGSLDLLEQGLAEIKKLGLEAVLGNGVAADIGCWMEACAGEGRISTAGEMNGYLKLRRSIVENPLPVEQGSLIVPPGYRPLLDDDAIRAQTVDSVEF